MVLVIKYSFIETEVDALRVKCLVFPPDVVEQIMKIVLQVRLSF